MRSGGLEVPEDDRGGDASKADGHESVTEQLNAREPVPRCSETEEKGADRSKTAQITSGTY